MEMPKRHLESGFISSEVAALIRNAAQSETDSEYILSDDNWRRIVKDLPKPKRKPKAKKAIVAQRKPYIHPVPVLRRSRGLGDTIAKATKAVGIKPCGGCKRRQAWLNALAPYTTTTNAPGAGGRADGQSNAG